MRTFLSIFVLCGAMWAQPIGMGVKVGVPATDAFKVLPFPTFAAFTGDSPRYTVGPYVEVRLPLKLALELDALYRSYDFRSLAGSETSNSWEFPLVVKH